MSEGRKLLISVLVVAVTLGGVVAWLVVGVKASKKLDVSIRQKGLQLTELQEKVAAIPALRQEQQRLAGELKECETILPNDRELNKIMDTLSEYEKEAKVELRVFSPRTERKSSQSGPQTSYKKVSYDLDLVGEYFNIVKFLNLLENHNRFVQVDSFNVKQKDEDSPINDVSLKLSTFVFDPKGHKSRSQTTRRATSAARKGPTKKRTPEEPFDLEHELASRYVFRPGARLRDPFTNPLTRRIDVAKFDKVDTRRKMTATQEKAMADTIDKQLTEVSRLISDNKLDEAQKLLEDTWNLMNSNFRDPEVVRRRLGFSRREQRLRIVLKTSRGEKLYEIVHEKYDKMLKAFEAADYDEVYRLRTLVVDMVKAAGEDVIHDRLAEVVKACHHICERADARREFAGIDIDIQGTFWSGSKDKRRTAVLVNNQILVEGERLKADTVQGKRPGAKQAMPVDAEIIVKKIDRDKVTFLYKSELIERSRLQNE